MSFNNNFERAKKLTDDWPDWKREYQLTKYSNNKKTQASDNTAPIVGETAPTQTQEPAISGQQ